jgi:gluconolactonase
MKSSLSLSIFLVASAAAHADALVAPAIDGVVAHGTTIELIKEDFQGTEGPLGLPDGTVIFTEGQANRITRIAADGSTSTFLENSNGSNGLALTAQGDVISVQTGRPSVGIVYPADRAKTLVDRFEGQSLNRPNDLVVDRKGGVYFTDPGARAEPGQPAPKTAVYYHSPDGKLLRLATDIERPNGIQLSPDEKVLYVANTNGAHVLAYAVKSDGSVGPKRNFAQLAGVKETENGISSGADGLAIDAVGRLYVATTVGVQIFDAKGKALGVIALPKAPQNLAFAGKDKKTLYVVGRGAAYRLPVLAAGFAGRAK